MGEEQAPSWQWQLCRDWQEFLKMHRQELLTPEDRNMIRGRCWRRLGDAAHPWMRRWFRDWLDACIERRYQQCKNHLMEEYLEFSSVCFRFIARRDG